VHVTQTTELPDDFRLNVDAADVSDPLYFQDFGQGPEGTSIAYLDRSAAVSYRDERGAVEREPDDCTMVATTRKSHDQFTGAVTVNASG